MTVISKTKYEASEEEIKKLFSFHKLGNVLDNAAYKVTCDNGLSYALKIAPPEGSKVLTYEKNMMKSEVFWYSQMHEKTDILCPKVYVSDFPKGTMYDRKPNETESAFTGDFLYYEIVL